MAKQQKTQEEILSCDFITKTDIMRLFHIGNDKAVEIFDKVSAQVESEGKINIPGRISWRRMYRMLGQPIPNFKNLS